MRCLRFIYITVSFLDMDNIKKALMVIRQSISLTLNGKFPMMWIDSFFAINGKTTMLSGKRRIPFAILILAFTAGLLTAATVSADMVRVTVSIANIRSRPDSRQQIVATRKAGDLLPVIDSEKHWWKVRLSNGMDGWIYKKAVRYEKETYHTKIQAMAESVLGPYLKWATLNEVYLEEQQAIRLDIMVTPKWLRLSEEEQKKVMIRTVKALVRLCRDDDLLKAHLQETPYAVFFDRYNTPIGQANEVDAKIIK